MTNDALELAMKALGEMDKEFLPTSEGYSDAVILLLSCTDLGADETAVIDATGYDPQYVRLVGNRLRNSGIWTGNNLAENHKTAWFGADGGIAFWLDVAVAMGRLSAFHDDNGEPQYEMTPSGKAAVEAMGKDRPNA